MQPNNQNPEQPEQPNSPPQYQPLNGSSTGRTLQPLRSEDEIRSEAQAARPEPPFRQEEVNPTAPPNNITITKPVDDYEPGSLITEPINYSSSNMRPGFRVPQAAPSSSPQKSTGRKVVTTIISLVVIAALGFGVYYYFFSGKLTSADLVESTAQNTIYSHPKDWKSLPLGLGVETYTNSDENSQSIATVTIAEGTSIQYYGDDKPDNYYETIRSQSISKETVDAIKAAFRNGGKDCTSEIKFNVEPDTKTNETTVGLALATGTCTREDGEYTVKRRTVIGKDDGLHRHITIGASESDWTKNKATYEAMLNSIEQASSPKS